jgi:excisionase family DNA binding protein
MPTKKTAKKTYYTPAEAARHLGISRQAINLAIKRKVLPAKAQKVTRTQWLISAEDLEAYKPSGRHQESGKKNS